MSASLSLGPSSFRSQTGGVYQWYYFDPQYKGIRHIYACEEDSDLLGSIVDQRSVAEQAAIAEMVSSFRIAPRRTIVNRDLAQAKIFDRLAIVKFRSRFRQACPICADEFFASEVTKQP